MKLAVEKKKCWIWRTKLLLFKCNVWLKAIGSNQVSENQSKSCKIEHFSHGDSISENHNYFKNFSIHHLNCKADCHSESSSEIPYLSKKNFKSKQNDRLTGKFREILTYWFSALLITNKLYVSWQNTNFPLRFNKFLSKVGSILIISSCCWYVDFCAEPMSTSD